MGTISEFQRRKLVSSAVGAGQADQSGKIIGKGVDVLGVRAVSFE